MDLRINGSFVVKVSVQRTERVKMKRLLVSAAMGLTMLVATNTYSATYNYTFTSGNGFPNYTGTLTESLGSVTALTVKGYKVGAMYAILPGKPTVSLGGTYMADNLFPLDAIGAAAHTGSGLKKGFVWIGIDSSKPPGQEAFFNLGNGSLLAFDWGALMLTIKPPSVQYQGASGALPLALGSFGAVPEPSSWALILLGFGALGLALRRHSTLQGVQV